MDTTNVHFAANCHFNFFFFFFNFSINYLFAAWNLKKLKLRVL